MLLLLLLDELGEHAVLGHLLVHLGKIRGGRLLAVTRGNAAVEERSRELLLLVLHLGVGVRVLERWRLRPARLSVLRAYLAEKFEQFAVLLRPGLAQGGGRPPAQVALSAHELGLGGRLGWLGLGRSAGQIFDGLEGWRQLEAAAINLVLVRLI